MRVVLFIFGLGVILVSGCSTTQKAVIPFSNTVEIEDTYTIIWNGVSKAYRHINGAWQRDESYDYQFDVIQKRYDNKWKSIKSMHRVHPDYDGRAGDRDQTMYFEVDYTDLKGNVVYSAIRSSLGDGAGTSDEFFRNSKLIMHVKDPGAFLPYNIFRITQHYDYEAGILTETVELLLEKDGKEVPFMKNEETAYFYLKGKLPTAPTFFVKQK